MMLSQNNISVFILAGGKSARMGQDKGLLIWKNKTFVENLIEVAEKVSDRISIIANNAHYNALGYPVFADKVKDAGPLAGICTGLYHSKTKYNLFLSCDIPCIEVNLLNHLINNCAHYEVTCPSLNERLHPLIGMYTKDCLDRFEKRLTENNLSVMDAIRKMKLNVLELDLSQFPNAEDQLSNINTEKDLSVLYGN